MAAWWLLTVLCLQQCVNGVCGSSVALCGTGAYAVSCQPGQQCDPVAGLCCQAGGVLPGGGCCNPPATLCGSSCCASGQSCIGGVCCDPSMMCAGACCPPGQVRRSHSVPRGGAAHSSLRSSLAYLWCCPVARVLLTARVICAAACTMSSTLRQMSRCHHQESSDRRWCHVIAEIAGL